MKNLLEVHGSKNRFFLMEDEVERPDYSEIVLKMLEQYDAIDGLLIVLPSNKAQAKMKIFNRDGTEASMCGNGLRCVARYVAERDTLESFKIETNKAVLKVEKVKEIGRGIATYGVEIGPVSYNLETVPMEIDAEGRKVGSVKEWRFKKIPLTGEDFKYTALSIPNPHLVAILEEETEKTIEHQKRWAELFNIGKGIFPDGVNVSYAYKRENGLFVRTYERGVGFTNACGTAMVSAALVAVQGGLLDKGTIEVYNPGGMVKVKVEMEDEKIELQLIGNATVVRKWKWDERNRKLSMVEETSEEAAYEKFVEKI